MRCVQVGLGARTDQPKGGKERHRKGADRGKFGGHDPSRLVAPPLLEQGYLGWSCVVRAGSHMEERRRVSVPVLPHSLGMCVGPSACRFTKSYSWWQTHLPKTHPVLWPEIYHNIISSDSIGYPRMRASGESSTTKHRLLHASGPHSIPPPNDSNGFGKRVKVRCLSCRVSMTFRVVRTNQYNQDLGLIHSTNGNHLESPNEGSSIDHQVTIHLHAQNITMFPTNETWYFTSQMLVSSSGGLILILTVQSTRNEFRMHSDY
ncbi:hypothetical protein F511_13585 [Dorcoceras hygrometricum]|uniref:Uncharacterized protein n=1 Tax=Dorcoceras hygrometricum TaxID=472368 RepID=A0A2Z7ADC1_9LAMI|nr:hypothetical protein F511_13585 [Dorcoceras hygrometricum]